MCGQRAKSCEECYLSNRAGRWPFPTGKTGHLTLGNEPAFSRSRKLDGREEGAKLA